MTYDDSLPTLVEEIAKQASKAEDRGTVAAYIRELSMVSPRKFGIAVATKSAIHVAGDSDEPFSIQSISKVFILAQALGLVGDGLWKKVGREPSGNAFNSIVQLEHEQGRPRNPFINAGAIAVTDTMLSRYQPKEAIGSVLQFVRALADDDAISIDEHVARSESNSADRNIALAHYMRAFGIVEHPVNHVLGTYFHLCAIAMSCRQLAAAGRCLTFGDRIDGSTHRMISPIRVKRILALMMSCGLYDRSGDFAFRVGLPAKSGVGGGILAIVPGKASIAVWSPGLDQAGNSLLGIAALEQLTSRTGWSVFDR